MLSVFRRALTASALLSVVMFPSAAQASAASHAESCYGYTGTFKDGANTFVHASGWSECFGIAPDRTIWHAWPNSGGWKVMPNNGRGDIIYYAGVFTDGKTHQVCVRVTSDGSVWNSQLKSSGWSSWTRDCTYPH